MAATTFPNYPAHRTSPGRQETPRVRKTDFGDGYSQIAADGLNTPKIVWDLLWTNEDATKVGQIVEFFQERGGYKPFWWTAPGDSSPSLWITSTDGWSTSEMTGTSTTLKVKFERWYGAEE